jgi:hypothetical protein
MFCSKSSLPENEQTSFMIQCGVDVLVGCYADRGNGDQHEMYTILSVGSNSDFRIL